MKKVFLLRRRENLSHNEIADILRIAEDTVSKQITRALKLLRGRFSVAAFNYLIFYLTHQNRPLMFLRMSIPAEIFATIKIPRLGKITLKLVV